MQKLFAVLIAAYVLVLSGCNTLEGFGEDVEAAGDAIDDKASDDDPNEEEAD